MLAFKLTPDLLFKDWCRHLTLLFIFSNFYQRLLPPCVILTFDRHTMACNFVTASSTLGLGTGSLHYVIPWGYVLLFSGSCFSCECKAFVFSLCFALTFVFLGVFIEFLCKLWTSLRLFRCSLFFHCITLLYSVSLYFQRSIFKLCFFCTEMSSSCVKPYVLYSIGHNSLFKTLTVSSSSSVLGFGSSIVCR